MKKKNSIKPTYKDFSTIKKEHFEENKLIKYLIIIPTLWDKIYFLDQNVKENYSSTF